ncbi:GNAT family N-acetyltransferase [Komagataeibacter oboediens]|uniref:GNAT family N-acetyltransferase n=1 Tax=Komagataeibacter oboediens TaxID=65958 RepID=UPI001C2C4379|nr:GNAT family N-acetyltransferase [Komagataeibacter oboediens]MBV0888965.1 GNAT family N-acetyltransferase [Komagataeibacter oboediens]MCK9820219.1 GNAT family N-acetyltransferase [Komagataeibacter oboediens]
MGCRNSIQTARLQLDPVSWADLEDVVRLKASAGVTGRLAGGICNRVLSEQDMMTDLMTWGREGVGMFAVRQQGHFIGLAGVQPSCTEPECHELQFAILPHARDTALSREATSMALAFAHAGGVGRVISYVRENDIVGRQVFGGAGMSVCDARPASCSADILLYHSMRPGMGTAAMH